MRRGARTETYAGVDGLIAIEVVALVQAVVRLAEGDAGNAPGHEAQVDRVEAPEECVGPGLRRLGRLGVDVLTGPGKDIVDARLPVVHVGVGEGARLLGAGVLCGGSHFVCVGWGGFVGERGRGSRASERASNERLAKERREREFEMCEVRDKSPFLSVGTEQIL